MGDIKASEIAEFLNSSFSGPDITINSISSLSNPKKNSLIFAKRPFKYNGTDLLVLCTNEVFEDNDKQSELSFIVVSNPRLAFAKTVQRFFVEKCLPCVHPTAVIAEDVDIHPSVVIGAYCIIESGVSIGKGTVIKNHVIISENVRIGKFCYIKSGAVVGEDGFGFDFEEDKTPVRLPHLGSVEIGDYVEIGSNTTVARGTLDNTVIGSHTKIDDLVLIAHNANLGDSNIVAGCADISGSVKIANHCWIGPNAVVQEKILIGDESFIGMGSIVRQNVECNKSIVPIESLEVKSHISVRKKLGIDRNGKYKV